MSKLNLTLHLLMNKSPMNKYPFQIGVGHLEVSDQQKANVMKVLDSNRLSHGPFSARLEKEFGDLHDRKYALLSNSGTSSLQIAIAALKEKHGWKDGDEFLCPALTFVASSNVILQNNLKPVFVDIDPVTYNIDPAKIEAAVTERTRGVMPVHLFGLPADMDGVMAAAAKHNLKVVEDSCETMFVKAQGHVVGSRGDIACFSTYIAHLLVTGVGGFSCTNDGELAVMMKSYLNHGRDSIYLNIDDDKNLGKDALFSVVNRRFSFVRMGYSYRVTELEAALGLAQLAELKDMMVERRKNADFLTEGLRELEEYMQLPSIPEGFDHAFMMYPIVLREGFSRDDLVLYLESLNIETRYMMPLINQPYYLELFGDQSADFPHAHHVNEHGFYIGCHQGLKREELEFILEAFKSYFSKF